MKEKFENSTNGFAYNQSILYSTEFSEVIALYFYCRFNNLDFEREIRQRDSASKKRFPDFIVGRTWLEVTRGITTLDGKQQRDTIDVFSKNTQEAVTQKNNELHEYKRKGLSHEINFQYESGATSAILNVKSQEEQIKTIQTAIIKKREKILERAKNGEINNQIDLFVVTYDELSNDSIKEIINWYGKLDMPIFLNDVYIEYNPDYACDYNCVLKMNKISYETKCIKRKIDNQKLAELIIDLGWFNEKEFVRIVHVFK